jgi:transcriptional regulator with XRE-family HTH domain
MGGPRAAPTYQARVRTERQLQRLGTDARTARVSEGLSQAAVASHAHVSQATVARLEAGDPRLSVQLVGSVFAALGMDLSLKAFPADGVPLRDSGQIALASTIQAAADPSWRVLTEAPVGNGSSQAADVVLLRPRHGIHVEVETGLVDLQAQLRRGTVKRDALQERLEVELAFVLALGESERNRAAVLAAGLTIRAALPATPREAWAAIRRGHALTRDGLIWVRPTPRAPLDVASGPPGGTVGPGRHP